LAIVCVISAIKEIKAGRKGKGLLTAALVFVAIQVAVALAVWLATSNAFVERNSSGQVTQGGRSSFVSLRVGDCLAPDPVKAASDGSSIDVFAVVPCSQLHSREVASRPMLSAGEFPGQDEVARLAEEKCGKLAETPLGPSMASGVADLEYFVPEADWFSPAHDAICVITFKEQKGSFIDAVFQTQGP